MKIIALDDNYRTWVKRRTNELFQGDFITSLGFKHYPHELEGFLAFLEDKADEPAGLCTYRIYSDTKAGLKTSELVTLDAHIQWRGIGTKLIKALEERAKLAKCRRLWLVTTNDNTDALRFYQKLGYRICQVHRGFVDQERLLKPDIPLLGNYGIPMRDEIELEKFL
jgi:GNAT superfamily N-acetyltransferase